MSVLSSPSPLASWQHLLRQHPVARAALRTGLYLSLVMTAALLAANRVAFLEPFAELRNWTFRVIFAGVALFPAGLLWRSPARLFLAGTGGWLIFSLLYWMMGSVFGRLHARFWGPFQVFLVGAAVYGVVAVALWVAHMFLHTRTEPAASRRGP